MGKNGKKNSRNLADPTQLKPFAEKDGLLQVVIETPKSSRNKYAFDPDQGIFMLKKVLPQGMTFPYDFGFLPRTQAEDGDPIDVLVLMDEPAYPGCLLKARLVGVMEGEQKDGSKKVRNDRLIAVAEPSHMYTDIKSVNDLTKQFLQELESFFVNYHGLEGKQYKALGIKESAEAQKLIRRAQRGKKA